MEKRFAVSQKLRQFNIADMTAKVSDEIKKLKKKKSDSKKKVGKLEKKLKKKRIKDKKKNKKNYNTKDRRELMHQAEEVRNPFLVLPRRWMPT